MMAASAIEVERKWFRPTTYSLIALISPRSEDSAMSVLVKGKNPRQLYEALPRIEMIIRDEAEAKRIAESDNRRSVGLKDLAFIGRHHVQSRGVTFVVEEVQKKSHPNA
jgi:hypothetical protein